MNHKQTIGAIGFFSLGALVAWAVTADRYEQKVKAAFSRGYLKNDLDRMKAKLAQDITSTSYEPVVVEEVVEEVQDDDFYVPEEDETPEETRHALQELIDSYTATPGVEQLDQFNARQPNGSHKPPHVISRWEYAGGEDSEGYAKITLTYYPKDRVLLDDDNDPVDDIAGMIGWRSLSNFGGESGDPDVVFVRNDRLLSDFEVVRDDESELPLHVKYGMSEEEFKTNKAAGTLKLRREDE
jgi:hypothetical protein